MLPEPSAVIPETAAVTKQGALSLGVLHRNGIPRRIIGKLVPTVIGKEINARYSPNPSAVRRDH